MTDTIRDLKERSDEVSDLERSMSSVQWDMGEVKGNLTRVNESLVKMTEGNEARDRKLDEFIKNLSAGLAEREKRTEESIENMERCIDAKMDEKLADLDTRISSIERSAMGAGHRGLGDSQGGWGPTPTSRKAVLHGFITKVINDTGMKEERMVDYPAIPITHVFVEFEDTRRRDRFVRSVNMRSYELDGRVIKISQALEPDERFDKKRLRYIKYVISKKTGIALYWIQLNFQKKSISINGQLVAKIENSGLLRYYKHEHVEDEVQNLMEKWLTKNT